MLSVLDLVEIDELAIELVAGAAAADRPLAGASANEHADPRPWLRGGELLMIDGLELRRSKAQLTAYVDRVVDAGIAALAIGIGDGLPFTRPPKPLVAACDTAQLPLLTVPSTTPFARVSEAIYSRLAQERFGEAPMLVEAQRALTRAAGRPASSPSVISTLARLTSLRVLLCDRRGDVLAAAPEDDPLPQGVSDAIAKLHPRGLTGSAVVPVGDGYVRIQAVGAEALRGFLVYGREQGSVNEFQAAAATFAASLLSIDLERQFAVRVLQRRPREDAVEQLIRGLPPAGAQQLLRSLGITADRVRIAMVKPHRDTLAEEAQRLADHLPEALVGAVRSAVLLVLPADLPDIGTRLAEAAGDWPVGLGGAVRPHQCPISVRQAQRGVQLARQRGGGVVDVMTLGSARLLLEGVPADLLRSYADATLRALDGAEDSDTLLRTLRAWLAACGVGDTAAAALGVHRHTLRHRIERVERLTGRRLTDAHDRGELWLAFEARDVAATAET